MNPLKKMRVAIATWLTPRPPGLVEPDGEELAIGRLTRGGALFGYLAVDTQLWFSSKRTGLKVRRWAQTRRRYRLALQPFGREDWDEGFMEAEDDLEAGRFIFKGEVLAYEELIGAERDAVFFERFAGWE